MGAELGVRVVALQEFGTGDGPPMLGLGVLWESPPAELLSEGCCCGWMAAGCELDGCGVSWCPIFEGTGDILGDSRGEFLTS